MVSTDLNGVSHANGTPKSASHSRNPSYAAKHVLHSHFIGLNRLSTASPSKVRDFVAAHDGHTVITSVRTLSRYFRGWH